MSAEGPSISGATGPTGPSGSGGDHSGVHKRLHRRFKTVRAISVLFLAFLVLSPLLYGYKERLFGGLVAPKYDPTVRAITSGEGKELVLGGDEDSTAFLAISRDSGASLTEFMIDTLPPIHGLKGAPDDRIHLFGEDAWLMGASDLFRKGRSFFRNDSLKVFKAFAYREKGGQNDTAYGISDRMLIRSWREGEGKVRMQALYPPPAPEVELERRLSTLKDSLNRISNSIEFIKEGGLGLAHSTGSESAKKKQKGKKKGESDRVQELEKAEERVKKRIKDLREHALVHRFSSLAVRDDRLMVSDRAGRLLYFLFEGGDSKEKGFRFQGLVDTSFSELAFSPSITEKDSSIDLYGLTEDGRKVAAFHIDEGKERIRRVQRWEPRGEAPFSGLAVSKEGAFAVDEEGGLYHLKRDGSIIEKGRSGSSLYAVHFASDTGIGYAAGEGRTFFRTSDGGKEWKKLSFPRHKDFGPVRTALIGGFIMSLLGLGLTLPVLYRTRSKFRRVLKEEAEKGEEHALTLVTDNPSEEDTLGFSSSVHAIVDLLKNPETKPPVTIGVNGGWGTGKSSLMLQVQKELEKEDPDSSKEFHCCWFNIWHFEKEQHILTAFLSRIFSTLDKGLKGGFRVRLFRNKIRELNFMDKLKFWFSFWMLAPVPFILIFLLLIPFSYEGSFAEQIILLKHLKEVIPEGGLNMDLKELFIGGGGAGLGIGTAVYYIRQLFFKSGLNSFFSLSPIKKGKMELMNEDEGTRQKYKQEFSEIMKAGFREDRNLVIFIDDLDRVDGQRVKDLLTSLNFISDTASDRELVEDPEEEEGVPQKQQGANIFFIIGMDCEQVAGNLNKVMEEDEKDPEYGSRYLEKLFDLLVQVPQMKNTESITSR